MNGTPKDYEEVTQAEEEYTALLLLAVAIGATTGLVTGFVLGYLVCGVWW